MNSIFSINGITTQAEGLPLPPVAVYAENSLITDLDIPRKKPKDADQLTAIQLELFEQDPEHHELRQQHLDNLPRQLRDFFGKQYLQRLKAYGADYTSDWFKNKMSQMLPRVESVMQQYADVFSLYHQPWQDLSFLDEVDTANLDTAPSYETAEQQYIRHLQKVAAYSETLSPIAERLGNSKRIFHERNLQPLCYHHPDQLKSMADTLAFKMQRQQDEFSDKVIAQRRATDEHTALALLIELYQTQVNLCEGYYITAPYAKKAKKGRLTTEEVTVGLLKLACPKFWHNKIKQCAMRMKEHLAIAVGMVSVMTGGYVSNERLSAFEAQRKANYDFIKNSILTNLLNDEEQVELLDIYLKSSSNPKKRRIELMTRMNGFDVLAEHYGDQGEFITLTAPSKYHAMLENGGVNPKWNGASPAQTQKYLCNVWAKIRAELDRRSIKVYGFRIAEPHHDATPHWHLLLYTRPEHVAQLKEVFLQYALEEDGNERGAREHRCTFKTIDREKGSGAGYVAKYVSKNVDGFGMDDLASDETDTPAKIAALRVQAWASTWRIRQFQQIGGASVGVWRELRRLGDQEQEDEIIDLLRLIADLGDWAAYTDYQGGALALRKELKARLNYAIYGKNKYQEYRQKVNGVQNQTNGVVVKTRLKEWVISKKPANWAEMKQLKLAGRTSAERSEATTGELARPWTCVSNCTSTESSQIENTLRERIKNELIIMRGRVTDYQIDDLLNGKPLKIYSNSQIGIYVRYSQGQLIEEKIPQIQYN